MSTEATPVQTKSASTLAALMLTFMHSLAMASMGWLNTFRRCEGRPLILLSLGMDAPSIWKVPIADGYLSQIGLFIRLSL